MAKHRIAVIPGDGIGNEVIPEGLRAEYHDLVAETLRSARARP